MWRCINADTFMSRLPLPNPNFVSPPCPCLPPFKPEPSTALFPLFVVYACSTLLYAQVMQVQMKALITVLTLQLLVFLVALCDARQAVNSTGAQPSARISLNQMYPVLIFVCCCFVCFLILLCATCIHCTHGLHRKTVANTSQPCRERHFTMASRPVHDGFTTSSRWFGDIFPGYTKASRPFDEHPTTSPKQPSKAYCSIPTAS